ncbi:MAG: hypothetical protein ACRCS9_06780 [Hyphomicrobium sp.]
MGLLKSVVFGFIAGALAAVTALMLMDLLWARTGYGSQIIFPGTPAFLEGAPSFASDMLWGGMWGALMGLIFTSLPQGPLTFKGLFYGLIGPGLLGLLVLVPFLAGSELLNIGNFGGMWPQLVSAGAFGAAAAWLYGMFCYGRLPC